MKARILGVSGPIAAGKTSLARDISGRLGWKMISSGAVLQEEAARLGLDPQSRHVLQDLGLRYIHEDRENFCKKLLESVSWFPGEDIVVDAIRHVEAIDALRKLTSPSEFRLVYITLSESLRRKQLAKRSGTHTLEEIESHPVESQVYTRLPQIADYLVDGALPHEELVHRVMSWVLSSFPGNAKGSART